MDFPSACFDEFEGGPSLAAAAIWATGACVPEAGLAAAARAASCGATPRSIASASTVASAASSSAPLDSVRSTTRLSVPGCSFAQARFDALHLDGASRRQRRASAAAAARQEEAELGGGAAAGAHPSEPRAPDAEGFRGEPPPGGGAEGLLLHAEDTESERGGEEAGQAEAPPLRPRLPAAPLHFQARGGAPGSREGGGGGSGRER